MKVQVPRRSAIKEIPYKKFMNRRLLERWADGIPVFSENNPEKPEWKETPTFPLDLSAYGYGIVHVKNEADRGSNPTQTVKDRAAWEIVTLYRDFARSLKMRKIDPTGVMIPRLSIISSGNMGSSLSYMFKKYGLPPVKLLLDFRCAEKLKSMLQGLYAEVYTTDLSRKPLNDLDIRKLTKNENGVDLTSVRVIEPNAVFYDWHVHEAFNQSPQEVYLPYGSGRLFENYITWQERTVRNACRGVRDPRLRVDARFVASMSILGAEPRSKKSIADKLSKSFNPFVHVEDQDICTMNSFSFTGPSTGVYQIPEARIKEAYALLGRYFETEPSACAGLALYLIRFEKGLIDPDAKCIIINTGKGLSPS